MPLVHEIDREELGGLVAEYLDQYVPSVTGSPEFEYITQGQSLQMERAKKFLSTCPFLCHMLLAEGLGCADARFVNRTITARRLNWDIGQGISKLYYGGQKANVFETYKGTNPPLKGDIIYVSEGTTDTEHVEVFLQEVSTDGKVIWTVAAAGQVSESGRQCAKYVEREFKDGKLSSSRMPRKLIGMVRLAKLRGQYPVDFTKKV